MSDMNATTPRVFIVRHGETEWAKNGRFTGKTDIELTPNGVNQVSSTARQLVGHRRLLDPATLARVWVSPRKRAQQTFQILFGADSGNDEVVTVESDNVTLTEDIAEWHYGDYEGLKIHEIKALRDERGLDTDSAWNIWRDGCEGGESAQEVSDRLDRLISQIRDVQRPYMNGEAHADVALVAHGHILRAFVKRWLGYPLDMPLEMMLEPGAIGILSYKNKNINEPAFSVGLALPPL
ncbi:phosphoglycerate mutase [Dactylonectria estremocensis]|uniref:Phosphoglycerate mutase n=1 Tax=Dactylonectria estremocensis TaxID=1079267 RepID=A0A9P9J758_9HYPO|nr:phosphoglycerate mutase [Dactylonectria estremocensis]